MVREVIATGRDVTDAINHGCDELGIQVDDAQFEIISMPKKGFLGLKTYPAKVRVYQELPDVEIKRQAPKPAAPKAEKPQQPKPAQQSRPAAPAAPKADKPQQQPNAEKPQPMAAQPSRPAAAPAARKAEKPQQPKAEKPAAEEAPLVEITPADDLRVKVENAANYLADIMRAMGFEDIKVIPRYYSENVCLQLDGAQMGVVIGRRGETLDALQYLTSLVANRGEGAYIRVNIDSGNYREKREKTLTALARKLALQAVRTGKSTTLEPMNPYERRIIHGAVSQIRGATSTSTGADPNRRVVIACEDPSKIRAPRTEGDRAPRRDGDRAPRIEGDRAPRPDGDRAPRTEGYRPRRDGDRPRRDGDRPRRDGDRPRRDDRPRREAYVPDPEALANREKLSDSEMFGNLPTGVPLVPGKHVEKPAKPAAPAKPEPRKLDDLGEATPKLYGKI